MWSRLHRYLLVELLREEGYTVIEAEDGKDALDKFDTDVDVIISDFNMPKMNGAELFWATQNVNEIVKPFEAKNKEEASKHIIKELAKIHRGLND